MSSSQSFTPVTPDLNAWMKLMLQNFSANINCISIGTIDSFDGDKQTATVAINYVRIFRNANPNLPNPAPNDQASDVYLPYPLLVNCPVVMLNGGGASITFPIAKGDTGVVFFNDRELDTWMTTNTTTYPHNSRTHDLSDGIILVGIRSLTNPISPYDSTNFKILFGGGFITISPTGVITIKKSNGYFSIDTLGNISVITDKDISVQGVNVSVTGTNVIITGSTQVSINP